MNSQSIHHSSIILLFVSVFFAQLSGIDGNIYTHEINCPAKFNQFQCLDDQRCRLIYPTIKAKCYILFNCMSICYDPKKKTEEQIHKRVLEILADAMY